MDLRRRTSAVAAECSPKSRLSGVAVARFGPQIPPAVEPGWIVVATECLVSFTQDDARRLEQGDSRVGVRIPTESPQPTIARPISLVLRCITVISTVVLRQPLRACDAEICPRNHVALPVLDDQLRLDGDGANNVQDTKQRLPRGLGAVIGQAQGLPKPWRPALRLSCQIRERVHGAVAAAQGAVYKNDQVEEGEIAGAGQYRVGRRCKGQPEELLGDRRPIVAYDVQSAAARAREVARRRDEEGKLYRRTR